MTNEPKILACVDATAAADAVTDYAAWAACRLQAPLELLHVLSRPVALAAGQDHSGAIGLDAQEKLLAKLSDEDAVRTRQAREKGRELLSWLRKRASATGAQSVDTRLRHGDVEETVAEQQAGCTLLVTGRAGADAADAAHATQDLGSHLEWVVRSVHRPVLVAADAFVEPSRVLFAFDGSSVTRKGVEMLAASPLLKGLPLHLLMAGTPTTKGQSQLDGAVQRLQQAGIAATSQTVSASPQVAMAQALQTGGFNLLVMGAYSHSPLRSLFVGSKTTDMLKTLRVATLLLR